MLRAAYENARVLLTGGTGYIGSSLLKALQTLGCDITLLVRGGIGAGGRRLRPEPRLRLVSGDMRNRDSWVEGLDGVDYVFHLAAQTSARAASDDPVADLGLNVLPVLHLLDVCAERNLPVKILFAGTVTQVGLTTDTSPVGEARADHPVTIYDIHKLMAEHYLRVSSNHGRVRAATLRLANVYGPGPASGQPDRGVLNRMVRGALCGQPLVVYGDGTVVRDYVFVDDVVKAFLMAGARIGDLAGNAYVIGSGAGTRLVDAAHLIADRVVDRAGVRPPVVHVDPPIGQLAIEGRSFVADSSLFRGATGWRPATSLQEGINRIIDSIVGDRTRPDGPSLQ